MSFCLVPVYILSRGGYLPYSVCYGAEESGRYQGKSALGRKKSRYVVTITLLILTIVLTIWYRESLVSWLIPGDDQITIQFTEELISDIRDGMPIGEALTTFCEEIVAHEE